MLRGRSLAVIVLVPAALAVATFAAAHAIWHAPAPFGKYLVYTAANVYDPAVPPAEGDLADWFHRQVMGRDDAAIAAERAAADAYFAATFGSLYVPGSLEAFALDSRVGYTAYFVSGENVPPEGWVVRDGGFRADLTDGTFVVYGDYNIEALRRGRSGRPAEPIIIHHESVDPIHPHPDGSGYFRCRSTSSNLVSDSRSRYRAKHAASIGQAAKNRRLLNGSRYCRYEESVEIAWRIRTPPYEIRFQKPTTNASTRSSSATPMPAIIPVPSPRRP